MTDYLAVWELVQCFRRTIRIPHYIEVRYAGFYCVKQNIFYRIIQPKNDVNLKYFIKHKKSLFCSKNWIGNNWHSLFISAYHWKIRYDYFTRHINMVKFWFGGQNKLISMWNIWKLKCSVHVNVLLVLYFLYNNLKSIYLSNEINWLLYCMWNILSFSTTYFLFLKLIKSFLYS